MTEPRKRNLQLLALGLIMAGSLGLNWAGFELIVWALLGLVAGGMLLGLWVS